MELQDGPTVYPTREEFSNFENYIRSLEAQGYPRFGSVRVVPPQGHIARSAGYEDVNFDVKPEIQQLKSCNKSGELHTSSTVGSLGLMTLQEYRHRAPLEHQGSNFWVNMHERISYYVENKEGTLFDDDKSPWNPKLCIGLLAKLPPHYQFKGVCTSMLYIGSENSHFCNHIEDDGLYSISYNHCGGPKQWFNTPPNYWPQVHKIMRKLFPREKCKGFIQHKRIITNPSVFLKRKVPVYFLEQRAGDFIVTWPYSMHFGRNFSWNLAEAWNFALEFWATQAYKLHAVFCRCPLNKVVAEIPMDVYNELFLSIYRPDLSEIYKTLKKKQKLRVPFPMVLEYVAFSGPHRGQASSPASPATTESVTDDSSSASDEEQPSTAGNMPPELKIPEHLQRFNTCQYCLKVCSNSGTKRRHIQDTHMGPYPCSNCTAVLKTVSGLYKHNNNSCSGRPEPVQKK